MYRRPCAARSDRPSKTRLGGIVTTDADPCRSHTSRFSGCARRLRTRAEVTDTDWITWRRVGWFAGDDVEITVPVTWQKSGSDRGSVLRGVVSSTAMTTSWGVMV